MGLTDMVKTHSGGFQPSYPNLLSVQEMQLATLTQLLLQIRFLPLSSIVGSEPQPVLNCNTTLFRLKETFLKYASLQYLFR